MTPLCWFIKLQERGHIIFPYILSYRHVTKLFDSWKWSESNSQSFKSVINIKSKKIPFGSFLEFKPLSNETTSQDIGECKIIPFLYTKKSFKRRNMTFGRNSVQFGYFFFLSAVKQLRNMYITQDIKKCNMTTFL